MQSTGFPKPGGLQRAAQPAAKFLMHFLMKFSALHKCILKMAFLKMALHCKNDISEDDFLYVFVRF